MRWLHCSDFHIGKDRTAQERLTTRIVEHVAEQQSIGFVPDLVFITGDIADKAKKNEYSAFRKDFLNPLREALGGEGWEGYILAVPGNHDVDRSKRNNFDRHAPLAARCRFFDPDKQGKADRDILVPRFKAYRQGAVSDIPGDWISAPEGTFSEILDIRGMKVGVIGINTAWLSKDDNDRHKLTPGFQLVDAALETVKDCQVCFVLGHHPLSWLDEESTPRLKALFGKHGVIYLHGHMHQADGSVEDGAGNEFLVFQAGAAFQARDGEPWENGLLWGEISITDKCALLSPRFWNPRNLDWPVKTGRFPENRRKSGADWWAYPLPIHRNGGTTGLTKPWQAPAGWEVLSQESLVSLQREVSTEEAERFFDGAEADWALAQSPKVARRTKVNELASQFINYQSQERPLVVHLTGPGGEGKSMVLRQTLVCILEQDEAYKILWHKEDVTTLSIESISNISEEPWIIATDAADLSASSIHALLKAFNQTRRTNIKFLLCSRDSDWRASRAERLDWKKYSDFRVELISGLSEEDASLIAASWRAFDDGKGSGTTIHERGQELFEATRKEAAISEGALLGGILAIRYGAGLRGHIANLMERLRTYPLESGGSLYEAFTFIALMHAEKLDFLSRPVLAKVLNCDLRDLGRQVIVPLAKEAAANGGTILLTRHRRIAETAVGILRDEYGEDVTERFVQLASAAQVLKQIDNMFVHELHRWRYELPEHFKHQSPETAVRISQRLLELDPENLRLVVGLARIYREVRAPEAGAKVLNNFTGKVDRNFWCEWSACAGSAGDYPLNAVLAAFALTDQVEPPPPDVQQTAFGLNGVGIAFGKLFKSFRDVRFNNGLAAIAWLGLKLEDNPKSLRYFEKHLNEATSEGAIIPAHLEDALSKFREGVLSAWEVSTLPNDANERIIPPESFGFDGMGKLFSRIVQQDH